MGRILLLAIMSVVAATAGAADAAPICSTSEVARLGAEVRAARTTLTGIRLEEMQTDVPPAARQAIEAVKDRIVAFVSEAVRCSPADLEPDSLQRALAGRGDAFEDRRHYDENHLPPDVHGNGLAYEVSRVPGHDDLLAVVVRLAIECGEDGMLLLFERNGDEWRPAIVRRSPPYDQINGAFGYLRFAVSPPDREGRWYLATKHITPWCTSAWRSLHYDLTRRGPSPDRPNVILERQVGTYLGYESVGVLNAEANRFQIVHDGAIRSGDIVIRRHVETYSLDGDQVRRIDPVAFNVRDFVDEWRSTSWAEAAAWTAPDPALRLAQQKLDALSGEYGPVRRCRAGNVQVQIDPYEEDPWFVFVRGEGPYLVEAVSRKASADCTGQDLRPDFEEARVPAATHPGTP